MYKVQAKASRKTRTGATKRKTNPTVKQTRLTDEQKIELKRVRAAETRQRCTEAMAARGYPDTHCRQQKTPVRKLCDEQEGTTAAQATGSRETDHVKRRLTTKQSGTRSVGWSTQALDYLQYGRQAHPAFSRGVYRRHSRGRHAN